MLFKEFKEQIISNSLDIKEVLIKEFDINKVMNLTESIGNILFDEDFESNYFVNSMLRDIVVNFIILNSITTIEFEETDGLDEIYNFIITNNVHELLHSSPFLGITAKLVEDYIDEMIKSKTDVNRTFARFLSKINNKIPDAKTLDKLIAKTIKEINKIDETKMQTLAKIVGVDKFGTN